MNEYQLIRLEDGTLIHIPVEPTYQPPRRQPQFTYPAQHMTAHAPAAVRLPTRFKKRRRRGWNFHPVVNTFGLLMVGFVLMGTELAPILGFSLWCFAPVYLSFKYLQRSK